MDRGCDDIVGVGGLDVPSLSGLCPVTAAPSQFYYQHQRCSCSWLTLATLALEIQRCFPPDTVVVKTVRICMDIKIDEVCPDNMTAS